MTATIDFAKLELKFGHKYLLFVDPTRVDIDNLPQDLTADVLVIPVLARSGRPISDSVYLVDRGGSAEEWIANMTKDEETPNGIPE